MKRCLALVAFAVSCVLNLEQPARAQSDDPVPLRTLAGQLIGELRAEFESSVDDFRSVVESEPDQLSKADFVFVQRTWLAEVSNGIKDATISLKSEFESQLAQIDSDDLPAAGRRDAVRRLKGEFKAAVASIRRESQLLKNEVKNDAQRLRRSWESATSPPPAESPDPTPPTPPAPPTLPGGNPPFTIVDPRISLVPSPGFGDFFATIDPRFGRIILIDPYVQQQMESLAPGSSQFLLRHEYAHHYLHHELVDQFTRSWISPALELQADTAATEDLLRENNVFAIRGAIRFWYLKGPVQQVPTHPAGWVRMQNIQNVVAAAGRTDILASMDAFQLLDDWSQPFKASDGSSDVQLAGEFSFSDLLTAPCPCCAFAGGAGMAKNLGVQGEQGSPATQGAASR